MTMTTVEKVEDTHDTHAQSRIEAARRTCADVYLDFLWYGAIWKGDPRGKGNARRYREAERRYLEFSRWVEVLEASLRGVILPQTDRCPRCERGRILVGFGCDGCDANIVRAMETLL